MTKKLLMGNEAMAHAALEAGVRVVAGYPGTPSSEIVETVAKLRKAGCAHDVHVEWSTNEKAALELLFGASLAGARGLFTCKQMGLNVASDALMSLNYVSVRGGLVLVVADDPGPISSQTEQDTRRFAAFAKVPVLDPATPEQAFDMIQAAFDLSERFHTPVIVRPTTRVDHASAFFDVQDETFASPVPEDGFERDTSKWVIFPRRAYQAHGEIAERLSQMADVFSNEDPFAGFNVELREGNESGVAAYGIVAGGISAAYTREALRIVEQRAAEAGIAMPPYRFLQVGTPYPFPTQTALSFAQGVADILVFEELDYVLEDEFAKLAGRAHLPFEIHGKLSGEARDRGENDVDDIVARLERFLGLSGRLRLRRRELAEHDDRASAVQLKNPETLPVRPPVLCPGCPHRGSFYAVKQALHKTPAVLCGDIGCYTLGNAQPLDAVDTCLCMGAGVTMAQGLSIADPNKKAIAFIGDSTFFASGMTGLANAAYNGHDITVMVLDNATTAMTGSQPHPGTGVTLMGDENEPLSIEAVLLANGFARVYHANPLDKDASIVAAKAAIGYDGPSAVIFESPCIQLITPDEPVSINVDKCTGCKKCITEIGCPGIGFNKALEGPRSGDRGQAFIDVAQCNGCDLCVQVCPFKAIEFPPIPSELLGVDEGDVFDVVEPAVAEALFKQSSEVAEERVIAAGKAGEETGLIAEGQEDDSALEAEEFGERDDRAFEPENESSTNWGEAAEGGLGDEPADELEDVSQNDFSSQATMLLDPVVVGEDGVARAADAPEEPIAPENAQEDRAGESRELGEAGLDDGSADVAEGAEGAQAGAAEDAAAAHKTTIWDDGRITFRDTEITRKLIIDQELFNPPSGTRGASQNGGQDA